MALTVSVSELVEQSNNPLLKARAGWPRVRLGDIATVLNGYAFKSDLFTRDEGVPLIRIRDVGSDASETRYKGEFDARYLVNAGELLIGMDGDFNCARWRGEPSLLNQRVCKVTVRSKDFNDRFLDYLLPGYLNAINAATSSTTVKHLSSRSIEDMPLPFPPLAEQTEIVEEFEKQFSRLDEAVANLKRVKANLKRYKAAVLKAAVEGRLVPTEAELACEEGRTYESGGKLLEGLLDTRRMEWKRKGKLREPTAPDHANLFDLPNGWAWASVDQLAHVGTGATPNRGRADYFENGTVPWVTSAVVNERHVDEASEFVTTKALAETNLTLYPVGTLVVAMYGEGKTRGKCAELRISATTNQALAALEVDPQVRRYLRMFLEHNYEETRKVASGGVQPNLNLSLVRAIAVPIPPLAEQTRIVDEVERHMSIIRAIEAQIDSNLSRASHLRQAVLLKAFTI